MTRISEFFKNKSFFLFFYILGLLFIFNDEKINQADNLTSIVIPHFSINLTVYMIAISFISICFLFFKKRKLRIDSILVFLLLRIPLYFIPYIYLNGDYSVGIAYAIIQCFISYFIGLNTDIDEKKFIRYFLFLNIGIGMEMIYTMILHSVGPFSSTLKWYMVLPLGKNNLISTYLLPTSIMIYFYINKYPKISLLYLAFNLFLILSTGSKLALILYMSFLCIILIKPFFTNKVYKRKMATTFFVFLIMLILLLFFNDIISNGFDVIKNRFTQINIFDSRFHVYLEAIKLISEYPLFGRSAFRYTVFDVHSSHNFVLESLVQTGLIGTVLLCLVIFNFFKKTSEMKVDVKKSPLLIYVFIHLLQGMIEPNLFNLMSDALFWFIIGYTISNYSKERGYVSHEKIEKCSHYK